LTYVANGTPADNPLLINLIIYGSHEATPEIWQETYVSAILRAVLYSDDPTYWIDAWRKLDPITTAEGELRFLQAAEHLFMKGDRSSVYLSPG
jgi:hypothetical protein